MDLSDSLIENWIVDQTMNTTQVTPTVLELWSLCFSIRSMVQDRLYSKADFIDSGNGNLLIASIESVYLTDGMLETFLQNDPPEHDFARSLWLWGAIQALVVQQDAVIRIGKALGTSPKSLRELIDQVPLIETIRHLRNRSVGHPTVDDDNRGTGKKYTFPAKHSGKKYTFLMLDKNTDPPTFGPQDLDVESLISQQKDILSQIVMKWRDGLMAQENQFRQDNRQPSLEEWLSSSTFRYHVSNLFPEIRKPHLESAQEVKSIIDATAEIFRRKGALRNNADEIIESMRYPISSVIKFFSGQSHLTKEDIPIYNGYLYAKFDELVNIAKEIDAEFAKDIQAT